VSARRAGGFPAPEDVVWPVLNRLMDLHTLAYRATGGLVGHRVPLGPSMLLLDHVGAKTGTPRTSPLLYVRDGDNVAIIASKGGNPRHPAWFHNLRAHPDVTIQVGSRRLPVHARVATDEERERLWRKAVRVWPLYDGYQARTPRKIPVVVLEPRAG
jgi:deazaflavin-dependent oxidoreductase (nitroreductase family)